jgi:hypothetical protein
VSNDQKAVRADDFFFPGYMAKAGGDTGERVHLPLAHLGATFAMNKRS